MPNGVDIRSFTFFARRRGRRTSPVDLLASGRAAGYAHTHTHTASSTCTCNSHCAARMHACTSRTHARAHACSDRIVYGRARIVRAHSKRARHLHTRFHTYTHTRSVVLLANANCVMQRNLLRNCPVRERECNGGAGIPSPRIRARILHAREPSRESLRPTLFSTRWYGFTNKKLKRLFDYSIFTSATFTQHSLTV